MSYQRIDGRFVFGEPFLVPSAAVTANGSAAGVECGSHHALRLSLAVTAVSGTSATLDITIETAQDNATWSTVGTFTQATGVSTQRKVFAALDRFVRARWVIGGSATPTVTFSLTGELV
jgi:hypothetical protein